MLVTAAMTLTVPIASEIADDLGATGFVLGLRSTP